MEKCRKGSGPKDINKNKTFVKRLRKRVSRVMMKKHKGIFDAKIKSEDEISLDSDETHPPQKRQRIDSNVADQTDVFNEVRDGGIDGAAGMLLFFCLSRTA